MSRRPSKYDWPTDEELVKLYNEGGYAAIADLVGAPLGTISSHIATTPSLRQAIEVAKAKKKVSRPVANKVGETVDRVEVLEHENRELSKQLSRARGEEVATERVLGRLEAGISAAEVSYRPSRRKAVGADSDAHTLVLHFSDAHAGEKVSLTETNGLNEYNWAIMQARLESLAEAVRSHRDHYGSKARKLVIASLGDGLSGDIHEELKLTNEFPLSECVVRFGEDVGQWIASEFVSEFESIEMHAVVGNHPRFSQKSRSKVAYDNGDWIAANITRIFLQNYDTVRVHAPKSKQTILDIFHKRLLLLHGEGVRTTMAGVPWGGIIRHSDRLKALFDLSDVHVDHVLGGHWHNAQIAEDWSIFINGSVKGIDEYGIDNFGGGKPAAQLLTAWHPKWGVTGAHKIDLQEPRS